MEDFFKMADEEAKKEEQPEVEAPKEDEVLNEEQPAEEAVNEEKKEEEKPSEEEEVKEEVEEKAELESEDESRTNQEKYPYPSLGLSDVVKLALKKVLANKELKDDDKEALANLLKAAVGKMAKYPKQSADVESGGKETDKSDTEGDGEALSTERAAQLLEEASGKIDEQNIKIESLEKENRKYKDEAEKVEAQRKNSTVEEVLKRELSMGLLTEDQKEEKAKIYRKLSVGDLKEISKSLENKTKVEVKKEALKGEEKPAEDTVAKEDLEKKRDLMRKAGISDETIKELYEKEDE